MSCSVTSISFPRRPLVFTTWLMKWWNNCSTNLLFPDSTNKSKDTYFRRYDRHCRLGSLASPPFAWHHVDRQSSLPMNAWHFGTFPFHLFCIIAVCLLWLLLENLSGVQPPVGFWDPLGLSVSGCLPAIDAIQFSSIFPTRINCTSWREPSLRGWGNQYWVSILLNTGCYYRFNVNPGLINLN